MERKHEFLPLITFDTWRRKDDFMASNYLWYYCYLMLIYSSSTVVQNIRTFCQIQPAPRKASAYLLLLFYWLAKTKDLQSHLLLSSSACSRIIWDFDKITAFVHCVKTYATINQNFADDATICFRRVRTNFSRYWCFWTNVLMKLEKRF